MCVFCKEEKQIKQGLSGHYINCDNCHKEIYQTNTQYNRAIHHFCSVACQKEYEHRQRYEDRACEVCGELMHVSKKSSQRFCSYECQSAWQRTCVGKKNPRYKRQPCVCDWCGADLEIHEYDMQHKTHHFCNVDCRRAWYAQVWSQTDTWRKKSRLRGARLQANGINPRETKPQRILNTMLDDMGIQYENEYLCKYFAIDNYLPTHDLMIEVMGDFWHSSPIKYATGRLRDQQKKIIAKDKRKHTYIARYRNIEILYLWEDDLYQRPDLCRELVLSYISHHGTLSNYHSFNYRMDGGVLRLRDDPVLPYFERPAVNT